MKQLELVFPSPSGVKQKPLGQRMLKIEATGDFWYQQIKPKIRLCGRWLERAGFKPGHHIQVSSTQYGKLTLELIELPQANPNACCIGDSLTRQNTSSAAVEKRP